MSISNDQIFEELLKLNQSVGTLLAQTQQQTEGLAKHIIDDQSMNSAIEKIELRLARQSGVVRTWGIVATAAAGLVSTVVSLLVRHH